jgi:hypothetical protein
MKTVQPVSVEDNSRSKPHEQIDGRKGTDKPLFDSAGTTAANSVSLSRQSTSDVVRSEHVTRDKTSGSASTDWEDEARSAHALDIGYIEQKLNVDVRYGLSNEDAAYRLTRDGPNQVSVLMVNDVGQGIEANYEI